MSTTNTFQRRLLKDLQKLRTDELPGYFANSLIK